jgi:hypothetical protein
MSVLTMVDRCQVMPQIAHRRIIDNLEGCRRRTTQTVSRPRTMREAQHWLGQEADSIEHGDQRRRNCGRIRRLEGWTTLILLSNICLTALSQGRHEPVIPRTSWGYRA